MERDPFEDPRPAAPTIEHCYRHPANQTGVHCTRCGRPICPECMIPAPVGYQCPECVARARREFRQGPRQVVRRTSRGLSATKAVLLVMLAGFVIELAVAGPDAALNGPSNTQLVRLGAMQPFLIADGEYWRLFTAIFLHAGLIHIAVNAYVLWIVGPFVEDAYGTARFLVIFFIAGFLGSVTSYAFGPTVVVGVGASGAIVGVFGAFVAYHYRRRNLAMSAAQLRWAIMMILLNAVLSVGLSNVIDWRAHLGGLVAGFVVAFAFEGFGPLRLRPLVAAAGSLAVVAAGIVLVVVRTGEIRALPEFAQAVRFFGGV